MCVFPGVSLDFALTENSLELYPPTPLLQFGQAVLLSDLLITPPQPSLFSASSPAARSVSHPPESPFILTKLCFRLLLPEPPSLTAPSL
ncbi:hypothetical protein NQZ68_019380 [Dissostichus eleginoides]|nr:hypothetical protein NQZ68_019380 [Dissostichus eleginoides]